MNNHVDVYTLLVIFFTFVTAILETIVNKVFLLLGSNMGEPMASVASAYLQLEIRLGRIINKSNFYKTDAWGIENQPFFINQVVEIETSYTPQDTLRITQQIEIDLGRIRTANWSSRNIDIDILYFNQEIICDENLKIPHPYLHLRNFTLAPLVEISPTFIHPQLRLTNETLLQKTTDTLTYKLIMPNYEHIQPAVIDRNFVKNTEMIRSFINLYLNQIEDDFEQLFSAIHENIQAAIIDKAHYIKPTMSYLGAAEICKDLENIEDKGKKGELSEIQTGYTSSLRLKVTQLLNELKIYYVSLATD